MTELLRIHSLSLSADHKKILDGLDLTIAEQEIHALLGTNGCGKSTLAFVIMGCEGYLPATGTIVFGNRVINDLKIHERARLGITLAWQEPARFEGISIANYLSLGSPSADPARYLQRVGLTPDEYLPRMVDKTLSGGQRKRIELASVLALKPKLAILDEPDSGIDMLSMNEIAAVIEAFKAEGAAVLLITHREEMALVSDRASQLCGGRIVFSGTPSNVARHYKARTCIVCDGNECGNG
ncbi:MAG: ABC transporter ATP-binding protein [Deltaproteobacteria bacterium]|nr:ABC transporter ATP-binding protein [Deltaproteobacteria bacterium]